MCNNFFEELREFLIDEYDYSECKDGIEKCLWLIKNLRQIERVAHVGLGANIRERRPIITFKKSQTGLQTVFLSAQTRGNNPEVVLEKCMRSGCNFSFNCVSYAFVNKNGNLIVREIPFRYFNDEIIRLCGQCDDNVTDFVNE